MPLSYYERIAREARSEPGVWVALRNPSPTTANIVTKLRRGDVSEMPVDEFEFRSYSLPRTDDGRRRYGVEVRYAPSTDHSQESRSDIARRIDQKLAEIRKLTQEVHEDMKLLEDSP